MSVAMPVERKEQGVPDAGQPPAHGVRQWLLLLPCEFVEARQAEGCLQKINWLYSWN